MLISRQPSTSDTLYSDQYTQAQRFTRLLGFQTSPMPIVSDDDLVTQTSAHNLMAKLTAAGITSLVGSAFQCLKWSYALLPLVEEALGCKIVLTAGSVFIEDRVAFNPSYDDFRRWRDAGITTGEFVTTKGFNFHVWYTLPNLQVLDLTLWSSLAAAWNKPAWAGRVDGGWPDEIAPCPTYVPIVLGTSYWERVQARSELPLIRD